MVLAPDPVVALASSVQAAPGTIALIVGSGISRTAQVPTGWDVVVALTKRLALLEGAEEPEDPLAWYTERFGGHHACQLSGADHALTPHPAFIDDIQRNRSRQEHSVSSKPLAPRGLLIP